MNYCSHCGEKVLRRVPEGDNRPRQCCPACDAIFYENPKIVVGCLVEHQDQLLLCRRGIEPRHGAWTCPGGFLELHEGVAEGAARETWEEALARVEILGLQAHFDLPHLGQVYLYFRARLLGDEYGVGEESLETELFRIEDIPWDEIAFPVLHHAMQQWVKDRRDGVVRMHTGVVERLPDLPEYSPGSYRLVEHRAAQVIFPKGDPSS